MKVFLAALGITLPLLLVDTANALNLLADSLSKNAFHFKVSPQSKKKTEIKKVPLGKTLLLESLSPLIVFENKNGLCGKYEIFNDASLLHLIHTKTISSESQYIYLEKATIETYCLGNDIHIIINYR